MQFWREFQSTTPDNETIEIQARFLAFLSTVSDLANPGSEHLYSELQFIDKSNANCRESLQHYLNIAKVSRNYYYSKNGVHPVSPPLNFEPEDNNLSGRYNYNIFLLTLYS